MIEFIIGLMVGAGAGFICAAFLCIARTNRN